MRRNDELVTKAEVIRRVEMIDQLVTILQDIRRSELAELKWMEEKDSAK